MSSLDPAPAYSLKPSDEELALRVRSRDEHAFQMLLERHEERVFRLAFGVVRRVEEARDVAQEVFLAFWEDPGAFRPSARFTTWLYRVTTNRAISHIRSRAVRRLFTFSDEDPTESVVDDSESAGDRLEREEQSSRIEAEIDKLPPRQRAAVHLRFRENLPVAEVAMALGVSFKSAESLLFRAKEQLRRTLADL